MSRRDECLRLALRYPGKLEALAARMGKRPDTLRKELTCVDKYKFDIDDEELLMSLCVSAKVDEPLAPLTAANRNFGVLTILLPQHFDAEGTTFQCLAKASREFGEFIESVADAESDGKVTANELRRVERELADLVAQGQACVARLRAMHEAAKPAHVREVRKA